MLYIYKGYTKKGQKEKFILFDENSHQIDLFSNEEELVTCLIEDHCSELNDLNNEIEPWIEEKIEENELEITQTLTSEELCFLAERVKILVY